MGRPPSGLDEYLDWQERLQSFEASGWSIDVFCWKESVSRSTFCRWEKQLEQGIPGEMVAEKEARDRAESAEGATLVPISPKASPVEIELLNGGVVRLPLNVGQAVLKDRDRMKVLFWDRDGFCTWYKRLERGTLQLFTTTNDEEVIELEYAQLVKLLGGLDLRSPGADAGAIIALVEATTILCFCPTWPCSARRTSCTTVGAVDDTHSLRNDLAHCHRLLLAAFQQAVQRLRACHRHFPRWPPWPRSDCPP